VVVVREGRLQSLGVEHAKNLAVGRRAPYYGPRPVPSTRTMEPIARSGRCTRVTLRFTPFLSAGWTPSDPKSSDITGWYAWPIG
jgi:hypothetical protein